MSLDIAFSEKKQENSDDNPVVLSIPTKSSGRGLKTPSPGTLSPTHSRGPSESPRSRSSTPPPALPLFQDLHEHSLSPAEPISDTVVELFNGEETLINLFMRKTHEKRVTLDEISPLSLSSSASLSNPRFFSSNIIDVTALIFSCSKYERIPNCPIFYDIQVCTRTIQGTLEIRIVSHCLKTFLTLFKLLKQTNPGELGVEGVQRKLFTDNTFSLKRRHELQRFLDEVLADPRAMASPYTVEFLALKRRPDRIVQRMSVKAWKELSAPESYDSLAASLSNSRRECAALANKNRALAAEVQVTAERARGSETRTVFMSEVESFHNSELSTVREWAKFRVDELKAELAERQAHVSLLTQASNALETENEKLRLELQTAKARFLVYERALDAARSSASSASADSAGGGGSPAKDSTSTSSNEGEELARLRHENMSLKTQVLRLEGLVASIQTDRDSRAREFEEATMRRSSQWKDLQARYDDTLKAYEVLREELGKKDEYIDTLTREKETIQAQLGAAVAENARLGDRYAALKEDVASRDLTIWLLHYQVRQLLREVAVMTVERDKYGIEPPRTPRTLLMYSGQYGEGLDALESVERQNAMIREQMLQDSSRIKALSAESDAMRGEVAAAAAKLRAERERCERYELLLEQNNVSVEGITSDRISDVVRLRADVDALRKELSVVKQRYFFDLAVSIKMETHSTREIAELYNELLEENVPVDEWIKWTNRKMAASFATPPSPATMVTPTVTPPLLSPAMAASEAISIPTSPTMRGSSPPPFMNTHIQRIPVMNNNPLGPMNPQNPYYPPRILRRKIG